MEDPASVESYTRSFDSFIQELNNHTGVTNLKAGGSKVLPFSDYGYFNLNPKAIRIGKFNYARDTLMFSVGYTGTPEFSSDSLRIVTRKPLPPVTNTESSPIINTYLNAVYDYSFFIASKWHFAKQPFTEKDNFRDDYILCRFVKGKFYWHAHGSRKEFCLSHSPIGLCYPVIPCPTFLGRYTGISKISQGPISKR